MLTTQISERLAVPFHPLEVGWKPQVTTKGKNKEKIMRGGKQVCQAVAFIDARSVMSRLDHVVGSGNWGNSFREVTVAGQHGVECSLTVMGVTKCDIGEIGGAGGGKADPLKMAYSDGLKRAGVHFGIGRYLYELDQEWPEFDGYRIVKEPTLPPWAVPHIPNFSRMNAPAVHDYFQLIVPSGIRIDDGWENWLHDTFDLDLDRFILTLTGRNVRQLYSTHLDALYRWTGASKKNKYAVNPEAAEQIKEIAKLMG